MIELFVPTFNEEWMLPRMIDFYRARAPDIVIHVHDNGSTDNTVRIAQEMGCDVVHWDTGGELRDDLLREWKNTVWKGSRASLVIVCDVDEWVEMEGILPRVGAGAVYWTCSGYDMIDDINGVRNHLYDKTCVFDPRITNVNYSLGAHTALPEGGYQASLRVRMFHMKYTMPVEMLIQKYRNVEKRRSELNKQHGWGFHYGFDEETIRRQYAEKLLEAKPIR